MAEVLTEAYADSLQVNISMENSLEDYLALIDRTFKGDLVMPDKVLKECFKKISLTVQDIVQKLLFDENAGNRQINMKKAAELLKEYKSDSGFYDPWGYNEWIIQLRDKVLQHKMLDFWRDYFVKYELGPCWARDSDLFDDLEDMAPAEFYNYAGCQAVWLQAKTNTKTKPSTINVLEDLQIVYPASKTKSNQTAEGFKKIGLDDPVADYQHNINLQTEIDSENIEAFSKILEEGRNFVNYMLFEKPEQTKEDEVKAALLLKTIKEDSSLYKPYDYNVWIIDFRETLFKNKRFDFWNNVVKKNKLGICFNKDCEFFDDPEDNAAQEFYEKYEQDSDKSNEDED